jgi:hypothetical protein
MKTKLIAALLVASSAALAAPTFASGLGPAPFYRPDVGAPASQRGQSTQTLEAEQSQASVVDESQMGVGGVESATSQSGEHTQADSTKTLYRGM